MTTSPPPTPPPRTRRRPPRRIRPRPTAETDTAETGTTVALADLRSCLDDAGLEYTEAEDSTPGVEGYLKVELGEGQFEDPSADGSFGFFGHALVFPDEAGAEEADELHTGSRFQTGRVEGNVYTGFNTDLEKVPETKGGEAFVSCVQGG